MSKYEHKKKELGKKVSNLKSIRHDSEKERARHKTAMGKHFGKHATYPKGSNVGSYE